MPRRRTEESPLPSVSRPLPSPRTLLALAAALLLAGASAACRGAHLPIASDLARRPSAAPPPAAPTPVSAPPRSRVHPGQVNLTGRDLAAVDEYIHARNRQWILGDEVEIHASREYFAPVLTLNARVGVVGKTEKEVPGGTIVQLTYLGHPKGASALSNPRVLIGTGLTVSARRRVTVYLMKTTDSRRPVYLRVLARGQASRGRKEKVLQRNETLQLGGSMQHVQGRWRWIPIR
jgi:hypothetical protein